MQKRRLERRSVSEQIRSNIDIMSFRLAMTVTLWNYSNYTPNAQVVYHKWPNNRR